MGNINNTITYKRGDIVLVDFEGAVGSEQRGTRPALIIQNNIGNLHSPTVLVAPLTSKDKKLSMPTHITIAPDENTNLKTESMVIFEQIRAIDKTRIKKKTGQISQNMIYSINRAISIATGIA